MDNLEFNTVSQCGDGACVQIAFKKSSTCGDSACTELAVQPEIVYMRNSTKPDVVISFTREEWKVLHGDIVAGKYNV